MDRPSSRRTRDHHTRRSHPSAPGTLRGGGACAGSNASGQQQQLTSGGNYSSTDSDDNEGAAVYESLTPVIRRPLPHSHSALAPLSGDLSRLYNANVHYPGSGLGDQTNQPDLKGVRTTNLDDEQSPLANSGDGGGTTRKDFAAAKIYQLLNFSPETASPETDDLNSETSNEHNVSDCPTIPVHGSSHGGSYMNPSTASDISCNGLNNHPLYQYGVQQLSVQHLHNPYLTASFNSAAHLHHHQLHRPSAAIYCSNHDSHLLGDHQDKHASASPTTTSSDRCLLPTSSSGTICKMSNNNSSILQYNPSMQSHAHDGRARPLSEHYHSSSVIRTPQCPLHAGLGGLSTYPIRTNLRPGSSGKPLQKARGLRRLLTWRNLTIVLTLLCLALVAALGYFAVAMGSQRQDDATRCSRAQEVISRSQYDNGPVLRVKRNTDSLYGANSTMIQQTNVTGNLTADIDFVDSSGLLFENVEDSRNESSLSAEADYNQIGDFLSPQNDSEPTTLTTPFSTKTAPHSGFISKLNASLIATTSQPRKILSSDKNVSLNDSAQNDAPKNSKEPGVPHEPMKIFTIVQTIFVSHYTDASGVLQPQLSLEKPRIISDDQLRFVSRPERDVDPVKDDWEPITKDDEKDLYNGDQFVGLTPSLTTEITVPPRSFWLGRITQKRTGTVMLNLTISPSATLILYGRTHVPPTHAEYAFAHTIRPSAHRNKRESAVNSRVFHQRLDRGDWYFGLYNDGNKEEGATLLVSDLETSYCPNDCNGQGSCIDGQCQCLAGFSGSDCSETACPLLCSGHGRYSQGSCQCFSGWKGQSCDIPEFQCDDPTCSGRGKCWTGRCVCDVGFTGSRCESVQCPKDCSQRGICQNGTCFCRPGWLGVLCDTPVNDNRRLCSNHGNLNTKTQKCDCDAKWTGDSCNTEVCAPNCGKNGKCENGRCLCSDGWNGLTCESPQCPPCGPHGKCSNGTCLCDHGWNGRLCTTDNCPNGCSHHGACVEDGLSWRCQCEPSWKGTGCSVSVERCDDNLDNDGDGLVDCKDNECCSSDVCLSHTNCLAAPEPQEVLLREQATPDTASFFDRVKFLIRENGVQSYVDRNSFDPKRASVIRGRVVDSEGMGLAGVRIGLQPAPGETSPWGFTTTRRDGMFDLLFNGGGSHIVKYTKSTHRETSASVTIGWNEFGVVDTVKMFRESELALQNNIASRGGSVNGGNESCELSSADFQPQVFPFWKNLPSGGQEHGPTIYYDAQVLQESFNMSGSDINLNHISSRAAGFSSLLLVSLTKDTIRAGLNRVIVRVTNAGVQEDTVYDARPNLSHLYSWNGINAYKQLVYGFSTVKVSVGYEGINCKDIFWTHQVTKIKGYDMPVSDIGSWDLSMHHRYNTEAHILHSGDGSNRYFSEGVLDVQSVAGTGQLRPIVCKDNCGASLAVKADLLAPVALASAPDGSLYIGDYTLIRRMKPDGSIFTVLHLPSLASLHKYFLAINPINGQLYVSLSQMLKVIRIISLDSPTDLINNSVLAVGNGMPCVPRAGVFSCGENIAATAASMIYPKGIAFDKTGLLYIMDGGAIRLVDQAGMIKTLLPQTPYSAVWTPPMSCDTILPVEKLALRWPTAVAVNPVDDSLIVVDDNMVITFNANRKIAKIISGDSLKCSKDITTSPVAIAVSLGGTVYVTETSADGWKIRRVDDRSTGVLLSSCSTAGSGVDGECIKARKGAEDIQKPGALTVGVDGVLYVADLKALKVFSVAPAVPMINSNMEIEVEAPEKGELLIFNRFGLHQETRDLLTGLPKYKFRYNVDTIFGKITSLTDRDNRICTITRDYRGQVSSIECARWKTILTTTPRGLLKDVKYPDGFEYNFAYHDTGLIIGRTTSTAQPVAYRYDRFGRLREVIQSDGKRIEWKSDFSSNALVNPEMVRIESQGALSVVRPSFSLVIKSSSASTFSNSTSPSSFQLQLVGDNGSIGGEIFYPKMSPGRFRRSLKVNESTLFSVEFNPTTKEESILDGEGGTVLTTKLDQAGRIVSVKPVYGEFAEAKFTYNHVGLVRWDHGTRWQMADLNDFGLPVLERRADGGSWKFEYNDKRQLIKVTKGTGDQIALEYGAKGGVRAITSPKGGVFLLKDEALIGFRRVSIRESLSDAALSQDFDSRGHLIAVTRPSGDRKIMFIYSGDDKLQACYFGKNSVDYAYDDNGLLTQVRQVSKDLVSTKDITYFGNALVGSVSYRYTGNIDLESVTIRYDYNAGLDLIQRKLQVGNSDVSVTDFTMNHLTRQIQRFGPFAVSRDQRGFTILKDENAIFMKQLNNFGKTYNHVLRLLDNKIVGSTEMAYNDMGQLAELKIRKGESTPILSFSFKYDLNGQLTDVTRNKQSFWKFTYDSNGNILTATGSDGVVSNSTYGKRDEVTDATVQTDDDGFVVKKGEIRYEYDAFGKVTHAWSSSINVKYHYDELQRLSARQSSDSDVTQFIYANLAQPDTVTHIYQKKTRTLTQLFYDLTGQLIGLARDGNPYYILQSQLTVTVYDQFAKTVKEVAFSPFGGVESDSNPDFYYPFDQNRNARDGLTNIVFYGGRPYDPESGRYLTPDFGDLRELNLAKLNPYMYQGNDPLMTSLEKEPSLDASDWVAVLGVRDTITVGNEVLLSSLLNLRCNPLSPIHILNRFCSVLPMLDNFKSLSMVTTKPPKLPDIMSKPFRLFSPPPFYGPATIVTSERDGTLDTLSSGTGSRIMNETINSLLSAAQLVPWHMTVGAKENFYVSKNGTISTMDLDISRLRTAISAVNFTAKRDANDVSLAIQTDGVVLNISYVPEMKGNIGWFQGFFRDMAVNKAWANEKVRVLTPGRDGAAVWSDADRAALRTMGAVPDYTAQLRRDITMIPQLAGDPDNVVFVRS